MTPNRSLHCSRSSGTINGSVSQGGSGTFNGLVSKGGRLPALISHGFRSFSSRGHGHHAGPSCRCVKIMRTATMNEFRGGACAHASDVATGRHVVNALRMNVGGGSCDEVEAR